MLFNRSNLSFSCALTSLTSSQFFIQYWSNRPAHSLLSNIKEETEARDENSNKRFIPIAIHTPSHRARITPYYHLRQVIYLGSKIPKKVQAPENQSAILPEMNKFPHIFIQSLITVPEVARRKTGMQHEKHGKKIERKRAYLAGFSVL